MASASASRTESSWPSGCVQARSWGGPSGLVAPAPALRPPQQAGSPPTLPGPRGPERAGARCSWSRWCRPRAGCRRGPRGPVPPGGLAGLLSGCPSLLPRGRHPGEDRGPQDRPWAGAAPSTPSPQRSLGSPLSPPGCAMGRGGPWGRGAMLLCSLQGQKEAAGWGSWPHAPAQARERDLSRGPAWRLMWPVPRPAAATDADARKMQPPHVASNPGGLEREEAAPETSDLAGPAGVAQGRSIVDLYKPGGQGSIPGQGT